MINQIENIETFLQQDPNRAIDIFDQDNIKLATKDTAAKIESQNGLQAYLVQISKKNPSLEVVYIQKYTPNGKSGDKQNFKRVQEMPSPVRFQKEKTSLGSDNMAEQSAATANVAAPAAIAYPTQAYQPQVMHQPLDLGNPAGMNGGMLGIHFKAFNHDKLEKELAKNEKKYEKSLDKQEKAYEKLEKKFELLDDENREAKSKIANFDKELKLTERIIKAEVQKADAGQIIGEITKAFSAIAPVIMPTGTGAVGAPTSGLGGAEVSETKQELIAEIAKDYVTDEQAVNYYFIIDLMTTNEVFRTSVLSLIDQHKS